jgi:hypothetical protein
MTKCKVRQESLWTRQRVVVVGVGLRSLIALTAPSQSLEAGTLTPDGSRTPEVRMSQSSSSSTASFAERSSPDARLARRRQLLLGGALIAGLSGLQAARTTPKPATVANATVGTITPAAVVSASPLERAGFHGRTLDPDEAAFFERLETRLPLYRAHFLQAERNTEIDWRLLAAIGYQESHWDPAAVSPTGVRGIMMLTEDTARRMNVVNRLDPAQSIAGGARYFALLQDLVPSRIREPDRTSLALAAYNQGYGHLEDARILAQRFALNADRWSDVRQAFVMKTDPDIYPTTRLGYTRGHEALKFVANVWRYYGLLCRVEPAQTVGLLALG